MKRHNIHLDNIALVARQLTKLKTDIVFTGGVIVGLLLTDSGAPDVRPTDDVDVIVGIARYADYASLQDELRKLDFKHDKDGPNCRFTLHGLKVDIMPSEGTVLGFTNRWYDFAVSSAKNHLLPDGTYIRLVSAPAFVATKLAAFHDRGNGDFIVSHDMEDIITIINGRPERLDEIATTEASVRKYISDRFAVLVKNREFIDAVGMHLLSDAISQTRAKIIIDRMLAISKLSILD